MMTRTAALAAMLSATALTPLAAEARPVSYPGGWTVMQRNTGEFSSLHVHYSPTARDSIGAYGESNWASDERFLGIQYNRLVRRWNAPRSQANLYAKLGAGLGEPYSGDEDARPAGFLGLAADWETRRWFTSWEARAIDFGEDRTLRQSARVGVAPYVGDYGDLHTWLMVEIGHVPEADTPTTVTPLVRFFYDVQLIELGYTPETDRFLANWIIRF